MTRTYFHKCFHAVVSRFDVWFTLALHQAAADGMLATFGGKRKSKGKRKAKTGEASEPDAKASTGESV